MQWSISVFFLITCAFYAKEESSTHSVKTIQTWSAQERLSCLDTWFVLEKDNCMCGNTFDGIVSCDEYTKEVGVQECFCITRYHIRNTTLAVLGQCMLNCVNNTAISLAVYIYHHVPRDLVSGDNNNSVCGYLHRKGTLCGQCEDGYYVAAYSYTFECIRCHHQSQFFPNWLWYMLVAYIPLTLFMIIILVFRVSVVSPKLYGAVAIIQNIASPLSIRVMTQTAKHEKIFYKILQVWITLSSVWNLDFF